jgi:hypothetical protein
MLDPLAEDPLEREREPWAEREQRKEQAAHATIVPIEPDDALIPPRYFLLRCSRERL